MQQFFSLLSWHLFTAATAVVELLMMGGRTPATCWAVNKSQDNKLKNCCIWLVIYLNCTMMHLLTNLKYQQKMQKLSITEQTRLVETHYTWVVGIRQSTPILRCLILSLPPEFLDSVHSIMYQERLSPYTSQFIASYQFLSSYKMHYTCTCRWKNDISL